VFLGGAFLPQFFRKESDTLFFAIYVTVLLSFGVFRLQADIAKEGREHPEKSVSCLFAFMFLSSFIFAAIVFTWLLYAATK
jgi:hypothetical protein